MVRPPREAQKTVRLEPPEKDTGKTVMLEPAERPGTAGEGPLEVTDPVEAVDALPISESEEAEHAASRASAQRKAAAADEVAPRIAPARRDAGEAEMDMTPMVDVTFLLLIFFMVTATFTMQKSLEIPKNLQQDPSDTVVEEDPLDQSDFVTVLVDQFNTYQVLTVDWEREAPSEQDLHALLREARSGDSTGTVPTKLRVEPHGDALHQRVVAALDAGSANGFEEVLLASVFDE